MAIVFRKDKKDYQIDKRGETKEKPYRLFIKVANLYWEWLGEFATIEKAKKSIA